MPARRSRASQSRTAERGLLELLLGTWRTEGQLVGVRGDSAHTLVAVDRYEWVPGLKLLAHYVAGHLGQTPITSFEIWAFNRRRRSYVSTSFDENGVPSRFKSRLRRGQWTILGDTQRFRGSFSKDRRMVSGLWEQKVKGVWKPWLSVELRKAGP